MIIAIDFDGTIVRDMYPGIGIMQPYAKQVINRIHAEGHYIIIWSCRTGNMLLDAVNYLLASGICFDRVNDHEPDNASRYDGVGKKIHADIYIDDKNLGGFPGWKEVERLMFPGDDLS